MIVKNRFRLADGTLKERKYVKELKLGKGGFADCWLVERMDDKKKFALKIIPKRLLDKPKIKQKMYTEIQIHLTAKHKNICDLERSFDDNQNVYMLMEVCSNGNMFSLIKRRRRLSISEAQFFMFQLVDSLCYLHSNHVIHRDIKLGNLLINEEMDLKLADFGLAARLEFDGDRKHSVCGTPNYIAPEIIKQSLGYGVSGHSYQADVWSSGVILYMMLIGKAPFETSDLRETYERICKGQFQFPDDFHNKDAIDLIRKILKPNVAERYTFEQILEHRFMNPSTGIPKKLPKMSLNAAPKIVGFEKMEQSMVKNSARNLNISLQTARTERQDFLNEPLPPFEYSYEDQKAPVPKRQSRLNVPNTRSLLRNVFSTSSLNRSLEKLANISTSVQKSHIHHFKGSEITSSSSVSNSLMVSSNQLGEKSSINSSFLSRSRFQSLSVYPRSQMKSEQSIPYVLGFKRNGATSYYLLSNGWVGLYQTKYRLIYSPFDRSYYEIKSQGQSRLYTFGEPPSVEIADSKELLLQWPSHPVVRNCQDKLSSDSILYVSRLYQVKSFGLMVFKFSNEQFSASNLERGLHLSIGTSSLILIKIENNMEVSKKTIKKTQLPACEDQDLIQMHLATKKVLATLKQQENNQK